MQRAQRRQLCLTTLAVEMHDKEEGLADPLGKAAALLRAEVPQLGAPRRFVRLVTQQEVEPMVADLSPADQAFVLALAVLLQGKVPAREGVS